MRQRIRARARSFWAWLTLPAGTPAIRDLIAAVAIGQGVVRIVDGAVFAMLPTTYLDQLLYGVMQLVVGVWLLSTRWSALRPSGAGRLAAAMMAGVWVMLAVESWPRSGSSWIVAVIFAWVMAVEARWHDAVADH